ncbi:MAG: cation diffusion facilitator family transporter [Aquihabitans sp.]
MNASTGGVESAATQRILVRMMGLSVGAAVATIVLKTVAATITGSVGFLSDAMESVVNLVAALVGLWAVRVAARPPDLGHHFGHGKAEYLSAAVEGALIFVAAGAILWTSIRRLLDPMPIEEAGIGLALSSVAALVNLVVGLALIRVGKRERSIALTADGRHLLTDVVTSVGVLVGIALVAIFQWNILDPIVALLVGVNILYTGYGLLRRSVTGLLDAAIPVEDLLRVEELLERYRSDGPIDFHALRTRESGRQRFIYVHLLVPDEWTVKRGHDLAEQLSDDIADVLPGARSFVHIEPIGDPASYGHDDLPVEVDACDDIQGSAQPD